MIQDRVVVTGAGGGIGSALAKRMVAQGHPILGLDRKPPEDHSIPWKYCDLADRDAVMRHLEGAAAVIHLGEIPSLAGPFPPDEVFAQNVRVASTVFQAANYLGVERLVYASSAQVYGTWGPKRVRPVYVPLDENHPVQPQNAYALSKVANEGYLTMLHHQNPRLTVSVMRFPAVVGVWWPWEMFVERLHAHSDDRDGLATYVHLEDLVDAFALVAERRQPGSYRVYNAIADDVANLKPMREYLSDIWPGLELPHDHPTHGSWAKADRIKQEFGWSPRYSVHEAYAARNR